MRQRNLCLVEVDFDHAPAYFATFISILFVILFGRCERPAFAEVLPGVNYMARGEDTAAKFIRLSVRIHDD